MFVPPAFAIDLSEAMEIIGAHPLAQLVVLSEGGLVGTPVPMLVRGHSLIGHLARPNPVWRCPGEALAIFTGPNAYVTPSWYPTKVTTGKVVPTWNYETVHVRGTLVVHDDDAWKLDVVRTLTDHFEGPRPEPWSVDDAPLDFVAAMLGGIVGIELVDLAVVAKRKLSQNRPSADRDGVRNGLAAGLPADQAVARRMEPPGDRG